MTTKLSTRSHAPNNSSKITREAMLYLRMSLPAGWQSYFSVRRTGKYWGLRIECPVCGETAPHEINPWNKWRWLTVHITESHARNLSRVTRKEFPNTLPKDTTPHRLHVN